MKTYHMITGLPRAGSTLLTDILNQNPVFHSNYTDHLASMTSAVIEISKDAPLEQRQNTLRYMFDGHYEGVDKSVIFNTNILWTYLTYALKATLKDTKMLVCVRDLPAILNSYELAYRRDYGVTGDVYSRAYDLMNGYVGQALSGIKQAISGHDRDMLMFVDYDVLLANPDGMMRAAYNFLGYPYYSHDFNNINVEWDELDKKACIDTQNSIQSNLNGMILPPDLINAYSNMEVWK